MNIQAGRSFGAQSMAAPLRRVLMRSAASAMRRAEAGEWHYGAGFDPVRAGRQHQVFADLVAASGAELEWLPDVDDGLSDSVFTHDPSLMTNHGAIILAMGKALRRGEPSLHEAAYERLGIPIVGRIERAGPGGRRGLRLGRRQHAGDRPRRAHQPGRHRADDRHTGAVRRRGARLRPAAVDGRRGLPASDVGGEPARRRSGAGAFAAVAGGVLPAPEGPRHQAGRRRPPRNSRRATASASTCCR